MAKLTIANRRRAASRVRRTAKNVGREVQHAAANEWLTRAARLGYVVRGVLYGVMGALALDLAIGGHVSTTDQRGAILVLAGHGWTRLLIIVVVAALAAYSLWGFFRAIYDPLGRGGGPTGIAARIGFAWSGLNYAVLLVFAGGMLLGGGANSHSDPVQSLVGWALSRPAGGVIVVAAGIIGTGAGLSQFVDAYKAGFRKDIKRSQMTSAQRATVDTLGRFGMVARGVIFTMVGVFILVAGLHHDAAEAHGFGAAFSTIALEPFGRALLAVVALGFIALAMHSVANARWVRMPRQQSH